MDNIDTLQELDSLRDEMNALKQTLNKEQIVNDKLLRTVMRRDSSWINRFIKVETILLIPTYLLFAVICHLYHISQWYAIAFLVLAGIDNIVDYRTYCIPPKLFSTCSMMEIRDKLLRQKKERFIQICISLTACLIWLCALGHEMLKTFHKGDADYLFLNEGSLVGGVAGGIIGLWVAIYIHRKAQRTNDRLLGEIPADEIDSHSKS